MDKILYFFEENTVIVNIISVLTFIVSVYTAIGTSRINKQKIKLVEIEHSYKYKIDCYSELLSLYVLPLDTEIDRTAFVSKLNYLTAKAKMLSSDDSLRALNDLIRMLNLYINDPQLKEYFYFALNDFIMIFRSELNIYNRKKHKQRKGEIEMEMNKQVNQTFLNRVQKLLNNSKITEAKLLKEVKLASSSFSDWKKGKGRPSQIALILIADYFNCSIDYLLGRTDDPELHQLEDASATLVAHEGSIKNTDDDADGKTRIINQ